MAENIKHWQTVKECCQANLQPWDCACSFGCDYCWVGYKCSVCGTKYTIQQGRKVIDGTSLPPRKLNEAEQQIYNGMRLAYPSLAHSDVRYIAIQCAAGRPIIRTKTRVRYEKAVRAKEKQTSS